MMGSAFWNEFVLGLLFFIAGLLLRPLFDRFLTLPSAVGKAAREVTHIWSDHIAWVDRHEWSFLQELTKIDKDLSWRGVYESGIRLQANEEARRRYLNELHDNQRQTFKAIEGATSDFRPLERLWLRMRSQREKGFPPSLEEKVLDSVFASEDQDLKRL